MARAKKSAQATSESAQDTPSASDVETINSLDIETDQEPLDQEPLDQEVRLAEAQPGDIEALEQALDTAEERASDQAAYIINQDEIIEELKDRASGQAAYIINQDDIIEELEETLMCLEPFLSLVNSQQTVIKMLLERLTAQATNSATQATNSASPFSRKDQALSLLNPGNASTWPGPAVSITTLAQTLGTNNKNISSVLTGLRDAGYQIATDELGRKFIKAYNPGQSAKTAKYSQYEAATTSQPTISADDLATAISAAAGTIVKRTNGEITRVN